MNKVDLAKKITAFFAGKEKEFKSCENNDSSYSIGGNLRATTSGKILSECQYTEYNSCYILMWDNALKIGNNMKMPNGKSSLDVAKDVCNELHSFLQDFGMVEEGLLYDKEGKKVAYFTYNYHSNYCVVKFRFIK